MRVLGGCEEKNKTPVLEERICPNCGDEVGSAEKAEEVKGCARETGKRKEIKEKTRQKGRECGMIKEAKKRGLSGKPRDMGVKCD